MARVRPHVKVHISVADHRKTSVVWSDVKKRGMLVELWRKAGERFAGRTVDRVALKPTDRMDIAGTTDQAEADRAVTGLCSELRYELRKYTNRWDVRVRKFSKKQGYEKQELQQKPAERLQRTSPSDSDSDSDSDTDTDTDSQRAPKALGGRLSDNRTGGGHTAGVFVLKNPQVGAGLPDPSPLLNALAREPGELDEKTAWLEHEWPLIHAEAEADPKPGRVVAITIRFYRAYLTRGPETGRRHRKFELWSSKQETRRRMAAHDAEFAAEMLELEEAEGVESAHR